MDCICLKCGEEFNSSDQGCSNQCGIIHMKVLDEHPPRPKKTPADLVRECAHFNLAYPIGMIFTHPMLGDVKTIGEAFINGNKVFVRFKKLQPQRFAFLEMMNMASIQNLRPLEPLTTITDSQ